MKKAGKENLGSSKLLGPRKMYHSILRNVGKEEKTSKKTLRKKTMAFNI